MRRRGARSSRRTTRPAGPTPGDMWDEMMSAIKALTFDTGGTILDWHRGISAALAAAGARRGIKADWPAATNEYRRRALKGMTPHVPPDFNLAGRHRRVLPELPSPFCCSSLPQTPP